MSRKVDDKNSAYKSKGMKAPRPSAGPAMDPSMAPSHKPKHAAAGQSQKVQSGDQSMAPSNKGNMIPSAEAPAGVSSLNGGSDYKMPESGKPGSSKV